MGFHTVFKKLAANRNMLQHEMQRVFLGATNLHGTKLQASPAEFSAPALPEELPMH